MFVGIRLASSLDRRAENVRAEGGQRKSIAESQMANVVHVRAHQQQVCYELKDTEIFVSSHPQLPKLSRCTMLSKAGQCSRKVRGRAALQFGSPRLEKALRISTAMFGTVAKDEIEEERT
ncbi:hypothetical protein E4T38_01789 [Aureobasidium subglaciale]|nr:hypothetical protein E4T38_01789 [Aureobasidium subglaciale]KAI5229322.1 hypothetical protein E4T40_01691 [Aureobasidium subglaciale]KAI5232843.1 hypothetical protein E4T41_01787 [Aureobasidium subglaciale]KAI5266386.1 hypothetical protein E4T46_01688 [Aureobasidium subglaciale]